MSQTVNNPTPVTFPGEQAERLQRDAAAMGLSVPAYVAFLERCNRLDAKARDAARFVLSTQGDSLRKLSQ